MSTTPQTARRTHVVLVDANILLYAADLESTHHRKATSWLQDALEGNQRVGLPWQTIGAFLRISTNPRLFQRALTAAEAWGAVDAWLRAPNVWVPTTSQRTLRILGNLMTTHDVRSDLVTDCQLAALAIEHGVPVVSADSDFARFPTLTWINPLAA